VGLLNVSSRVSTAGLVGLVALTTVLVGWAITSSGTTPTASRSANVGATATTEDPSTTPTLTPSPTPTLTPSPTPTPSATATTATNAPAPLQTILVGINNKQAWRITVGSCAKGGAKLAITTDGGTTWADAKTSLSTIVRVRPTDGRTAFVVGADSKCAAELKSTSNAGATWASGSAVGNAWFRDPKSPVTVRSPGPASSAPCGPRAVLDLAVQSAGSARVLCADGLVRSTTDTGASWTDSGKASGAVALAVSSTSPAQTYVAILDAPGCAGVQIRRVDQSTPTSCIETTAPKTPGQIALSLVAGGGWLSIGDTTMRSTDKLVTWRTS
jgi:hypothetical protein